MSKYIILHQGKPFMNYFFDSDEQARNWLKMNSPKRKWKIEKDIFICYLSGAKFEITELINPNIGY